MLRHLRAAAVLFHVLAITAQALPAPPSTSRAALLKTPQGVEQVAAWAEVVRALGVEVSDEDFGEWLWRTGRAWSGARGAALRPLAPYYEITGTRQAWRMFSVVSRRITSLEILARRGGGWQRVYSNGVSGPRWRAEQLDQERVRAFVSSYALLTRRADYERFVRAWIAPTLLADEPDVEAVTVQLRRRRALPARKVRAGEVAGEQLLWVITVAREELPEAAPGDGPGAAP